MKKRFGFDNRRFIGPKDGDGDHRADGPNDGGITNFPFGG